LSVSCFGQTFDGPRWPRVAMIERSSPRGSGGIGRRASLRSLLEQSSGGSSPPFRTIERKGPGYRAFFVVSSKLANQELTNSPEQKFPSSPDAGDGQTGLVVGLIDHPDLSRRDSDDGEDANGANRRRARARSVAPALRGVDVRADVRSTGARTNR